MMNPHRSRFLLVALLLALALGAAACSSGDDTATEGDDAPSGDDADDESGDDTGDEPAESTSSTTSTAAPTTTTTTTTVPAADPAVAAYCAAKAEAEALADDVDPFDPIAVEAWAKANVAALDAILPGAPAAIADDLATIRAGFDGFIAVLEANGWDLIASSGQLDALSEAPEQVAAEDRIEEWEEAFCVAAVDQPDEGTSFEEAMASPEAFAAVLDTEWGRALVIEGMTEDGDITVEQAECMLDNLDASAMLELAALGQTGETPSPEVLAALITLLDTCDLADAFGG